MSNPYFPQQPDPNDTAAMIEDRDALADSIAEFMEQHGMDAGDGLMERAFDRLLERANARRARQARVNGKIDELAAGLKAAR